MDSNRLQNLMQEKMGKMPSKAHRVVSWLLSHMREAAFRSIGEVAEELAVSKAQLVRVARLLGFQGYSELKDAFREAILDQVNPAAMLAKSKGDEESLPHKILKMEHANLEDTWAQIDMEKIASFCALVKESNAVFCLGWGISSLVAESLSMRLQVMGVKGHLIKRGALTFAEMCRCLAKGDALIACELPSYVVEVTEAVESCYRKGVSIVTITDSPAAPICRFGTQHFFVSAASPTFGSSIIGPLFLANVLCSALALSLGDAARHALEEQAEFLHDTRIFHPIFGLKY